MATGSDTGLFRAITPETGRKGDGGTVPVPGRRNRDGEGMRRRMSASRRETEAYFADSRRDERPGRSADKGDAIDYKEVKKEAKAEYRKIKESAAKAYEERLDDARGEFLRSAVRSREEYQLAKDGAREELDQLLSDAREQYEFTVDMARDLKVGIKGAPAGGGRSKKTTRKIAKAVDAGNTRRIGRRKAPSLDEELRQVMFEEDDLDPA